MMLNDAHHWRRATDVRHGTKTESRRPVHEPGWAASSFLPQSNACNAPAESGYGDERRDVTRKTGRIAYLPNRLPIAVSYDEDVSKIELRLVYEGTGRCPTINLEMNHEAEQTNNQ